MSLLPKFVIAVVLLLALAFFAAGSDFPGLQKYDVLAHAKSRTHDSLGDPLPLGALDRLGSSRLHHGFPVNALAFSPDGKVVASSCEDSIFLWDVATGKLIRHFRLDWVTCLAFSPNGKELAAGSGIGISRLWDLSTGKETRHFGDGTKGKIRSLAFSPDGNTLAITSRGVSFWDVSTWEVSTGKSLKQFGNMPAFALSFSANGQLLALALDSGIHVRETASGQERHTIPNPGLTPQAVAFSGDGKTLLLVQKNHALLFDWMAGKEFRRFKLDSPGATICALSPDGKKLALVDAHHTIRFLDQNGAPLPSSGRNKSGITSVNVSQDETAVITLESNGNVFRREMQSQKETALFQMEPGLRGFLGLSSDGKFLARTLPNNYISIQDLMTGKEVGKIQIGPKDVAEKAVFSSDNRILALGFQEGPIAIYHLGNLEKPTSFPPTPAKNVPLLFSPNAKILAAIERDQFIRILETNTGKQLARWPGVANRTPIAFSSDNRLVATAGEDGIIILREVATGQEIRLLQGHLGKVYALAFSPDGRALASGGLDSLAKIWEVSSGAEVRKFQGHSGPVTALVFSPDGRSLITGSSDTTLLMWDITGRLQNQAFIPGSLESGKFLSLWESLAGSDGSIAYDSIWRLVLLHKDSLPFLLDRLHSYTEADQKRIGKLIEDLDDDNFTIREKATADLESLVKWAEAPLRQALANNPSLEVQKRIEKILEKLQKGTSWPQERLRVIRLIEILEKIGTRETEQGLEKLVKAGPDAEIRAEAKLALDRLKKRQ